MMDQRDIRTSIGALSAAILAAVISGCSHQTPSPPPSVSSNAVPVAAPTPLIQTAPKHLVAYVLPSKADHNFASQDDNGLVAVAVQPDASNPAKSAVEALITGSDSPLPPGTKLIALSVNQATKTATVDFSKQFQTNFKGGESHEAQAVNSVLRTLGQFPDVHQVQFLVAGHKIDSLGGNVELDEPLPTPQQSQQIASSAG